MNMFYRRSINEYQRQIGLKESFAIHTERLTDVFDSIKWTSFEEPTTNRGTLSQRFPLLLLFPLVEIAWADGRVSRRESDAILEVARAFDLIKTDAGYCELLEILTSRPAPHSVGRMWQDLNNLFEKLSPLERQTVAYSLTVQAQFIAEQSSDNLMAFLRGERVSQSEREALAIVAGQIERAEEAAEEAERRKMVDALAGVERELYIARSTEIFGGAVAENKIEEIETGSMDEFDKLIPLVPLVKVAWAEGRITRRERELIFGAAARMGVETGSPAFQRLEGWLEFHPTDEFYIESLERLHGEFEKLPEEDRALRRLDLLSDCVNVAEASGGTSRYPAGGRRVCDEEFAAVKRIAGKLNGEGDEGVALAV